jgi:hypothetical protein
VAEFVGQLQLIVAGSLCAGIFSEQGMARPCGRWPVSSESEDQKSCEPGRYSSSLSSVER